MQHPDDLHPIRAVMLSSDEHAAFIRLSRCMRRRVLRAFGLEMAGAHVRAREDGGVVFWRYVEAPNDARRSR